MSVNRRIGRNLPTVMGQRDPEAMIRVRSRRSASRLNPIRASGLVPRQQAGHMTASDRSRQNAKKPLHAGGHPHMTVVASANGRTNEPLVSLEATPRISPQKRSPTRSTRAPASSMRAVSSVTPAAISFIRILP